MTQKTNKIADLETLQPKIDMLTLVFSKCNIMFSKTVAAKLVGGHAKLNKLIERGKVRFEKKATGTRNGKWYCNGADVIQHIRINNILTHAENEKGQSGQMD